MVGAGFISHWHHLTTHHRTASQLIFLREAARTAANCAQPIILAYGTCASAKIAAIRSLCGRRWLRGTLVWRVRRCERASFMACGRSGRLTPKVYEARARAIDALFDVTPGESVGMLSALKGFGGCVGITFGWFGEGSSNVHHLIRFASQALADRCWDGLVGFSGRCSSPLQGRAFP